MNYTALESIFTKHLQATLKSKGFYQFGHYPLFHFHSLTHLFFNSECYMSCIDIVFFVNLVGKYFVLCYRSIDKPRIQPSHTDTSWLDADTWIAVQESRKEWITHFERGLGHLASVLAQRIRGTVWSNSEIGHRKWHQCVWYFGSSFRYVECFIISIFFVKFTKFSLLFYNRI